MKKNKILILLLVFLITGCFKNDTMENITIYTTSYPIEYVTSRLYGNHAKIKSIYPDGMQKGYVVSDKLLGDYSKADLFIFNGLMEYIEIDQNNKTVKGLPNIVTEKKYASKMLEKNRKLKIIDTAVSISYNEDVNELWLDPINLLTVSNNIKKGFNEYITNTYLIEEINTNYLSLKDELLKLDADYREVVNRSKYNTILVANDLLKYLQKYNLNIISLESSVNSNQKDFKTAEELIISGDIKYVYATDENNISDQIKQLINKYEIEVIYLNDLDNLTDDERKNNEDYFTLMYKNLDLLKEELYKIDSVTE